MQNQNKKNIWIVLFLIISTWSINSQALEFDNEQPTVLITGSNRNIGLEFVKQFSNKNWNVIATTRRPEDSKDLNDFAKNKILPLSFLMSPTTRTSPICLRSMKIKP